jgi:hypothetical protein
VGVLSRWRSRLRGVCGLGGLVINLKRGVLRAEYVLIHDEGRNELIISRRPTSLLKHLISLRVTLSTAPMEFIIDFLDARGLDKLEVIMIKLAPLPKDRGDMNEQIVGEILKCLRILMNIDVSFSC